MNNKIKSTLMKSIFLGLLALIVGLASFFILTDKNTVDIASAEVSSAGAETSLPFKVYESTVLTGNVFVEDRSNVMLSADGFSVCFSSYLTSEAFVPCDLSKYLVDIYNRKKVANGSYVRYATSTLEVRVNGVWRADGVYRYEDGSIGGYDRHYLDTPVAGVSITGIRLVLHNGDESIRVITTSIIDSDTNEVIMNNFKLHYYKLSPDEHEYILLPRVYTYSAPIDDNNIYIKRRIHYELINEINSIFATNNTNYSAKNIKIELMDRGSRWLAPVFSYSDFLFVGMSSDHRQEYSYTPHISINDMISGIRIFVSKTAPVVPVSASFHCHGTDFIKDLIIEDISLSEDRTKYIQKFTFSNTNEPTLDYVKSLCSNNLTKIANEYLFMTHASYSISGVSSPFSSFICSVENIVREGSSITCDFILIRSSSSSFDPCLPFSLYIERADPTVSPLPVDIEVRNNVNSDVGKIEFTYDSTSTEYRLLNPLTITGAKCGISVPSGGYKDISINYGNVSQCLSWSSNISYFEREKPGVYLYFRSDFVERPYLTINFIKIVTLPVTFEYWDLKAGSNFELELKNIVVEVESGTTVTPPTIPTFPHLGFGEWLHKTSGDETPHGLDNVDRAMTFCNSRYSPSKIAISNNMNDVVENVSFDAFAQSYMDYIAYTAEVPIFEHYVLKSVDTNLVESLPGSRLYYLDLTCAQAPYIRYNYEIEQVEHTIDYHEVVTIRNWLGFNTLQKKVMKPFGENPTIADIPASSMFRYTGLVLVDGIWRPNYTLDPIENAHILSNGTVQTLKVITYNYRFAVFVPRPDKVIGCRVIVDTNLLYINDNAEMDLPQYGLDPNCTEPLYFNYRYFLPATIKNNITANIVSLEVSNTHDYQKLVGKTMSSGDIVAIDQPFYIIEKYFLMDMTDTFPALEKNLEYSFADDFIKNLQIPHISEDGYLYLFLPKGSNTLTCTLEFIAKAKPNLPFYENFYYTMLSFFNGVSNFFSGSWLSNLFNNSWIKWVLIAIVVAIFLPLIIMFIKFIVGLFSKAFKPNKNKRNNRR